MARPEKNYQIVSYAPGTTSPLLTNLINSKAYIYLRGHGTPGDPMIKPTNSFNNPNAIHIRESIDRLCEMGLKSHYRGMIKFYSCYSGVSGIDRQRKVDTVQRKYGFGKLRFGEKVLKTKWVNIPRPEGTWDPLALRGADYLRALGFNQCTIWGYMGLCSREIEQDDDETVGHKHVQPMAYQHGTSVLVATGERGRAAAHRRQF